jgi:hypothetical protein
MKDNMYYQIFRPYRTCVVCGETKLLNTDYWNKNRSNTLGFNSKCKDCVKAYNRNMNQKKKAEKLHKRAKEASKKAGKVVSIEAIRNYKDLTKDGKAFTAEHNRALPEYKKAMKNLFDGVVSPEIVQRELAELIVCDDKRSKLEAIKLYLNYTMGKPIARQITEDVTEKEGGSLSKELEDLIKDLEPTGTDE